MKNDTKDRENLKRSAGAFGELLWRHTSLHRPERLSVHAAWENGWYLVVAKPSSTVAIHVFLDCAIDKKARGYWVGLESSKQNEIDRIVELSGLRTGKAFDDDNPDPPKDRRFPIMESWIEDGSSYFGIYSEPGSEFDISRALHFVCDVLPWVPDLKESVRLDDITLDVAAIEHDPSLDETTKKRLIDARVGQGAYRQKLEKLWDGKCAVLGITNRRVLRASHVKSWKLSNNKERLDPQNGLLLAAHLDALFDACLITFSPAGELIVSDELSTADRELLRIGVGLSREPSGRLKSYLQHHRETFTARHGK